MGIRTIGTAVIAYIVLLVVGFVGWVLNIVTIAQSDFSHWTGMLILRVIGVLVPPLGAVLGFIP